MNKLYFIIFALLTIHVAQAQESFSHFIIKEAKRTYSSGCRIGEEHQHPNDICGAPTVGHQLTFKLLGNKSLQFDSLQSGNKMYYFKPTSKWEKIVKLKKNLEITVNGIDSHFTIAKEPRTLIAKKQGAFNAILYYGIFNKVYSVKVDFIDSFLAPPP